MALPPPRAPGPPGPLKKHLTPFSKKGSVHVHKGKGATEQVMPSRHTINSITGGQPLDRAAQQYGKMTPMMGGMAPNPASDVGAGGDDGSL